MNSIDLASLNNSGLLNMICPICDFKMQKVELNKMNTCNCCDSDIEALPPKGDSVYCESGTFLSRHH